MLRSHSIHCTMLGCWAILMTHAPLAKGVKVTPLGGKVLAGGKAEAVMHAD